MPKSLNDLQLKDEPLPTAGQPLDDLPSFGSVAPPPQPGAYRFRLPGDLTTVWDVLTFAAANGQPAKERVQMILDQNHPLLIVQSPGGKENNNPFQTRLNNNERPRGRQGSLGLHSDLDYVIAAFDPKRSKPKSNREYIEVIRTYGGKEFGADIRWSWGCSKERNIRVMDKDKNIVEVENKKGCGERYYQEDVEKQPNGEFPLQIQCTCGAMLRAFGNLDNIRA
jgi:hypothetical protein